MTGHTGGRRRTAGIVIALVLACAAPASAFGFEWSTPRAVSDRAWMVSDPAAKLGEDGYGVVSWSSAPRPAFPAIRPWLATRLPGDEGLRKRRAIGPRRSATIGIGMAEEEGKSFHVIWRRSGIGVRTHSADGTLGPLRRVAPARSEAIDFDVAPDGTAVIAWIARAGLRAAIREPGSEFGPPVAILDESDAYFQAGASSGGGAVVAWQPFFGPLSNRAAHVSIRPPGGTTFAAPLRVPTSARLDLFSVAINDEGAVAALFEEFTDSITVKAAVRPSGGAFPAPVQIAVGASNVFPFVEADGSGRFVAAWDRLTPSFDDFGAQVATHVEASGWSHPSLASRRGMAMSSLDVSPGGAIGIGLYDVRASRRILIDYAASIAPAGEPLSIAEPIHTIDPARELIVPDVAVDDGGAAIATWPTREVAPGRVIVSLRTPGAASPLAQGAAKRRGGCDCRAADRGLDAGAPGSADAGRAHAAPALPPALERLLAPPRRR